MKATPFVKWAGGKRQLIDKLVELAPKKYKVYHEPFVGGGALLLQLQPKRAAINDSNKELMAVYQCLRNKRYFDKMVALLKEHEANHSEEYYYQIRALDRKRSFKKQPVYFKAARMIYLNKACFNGLFRVNSKGYFNVPFNGNAKVHCYDEENFKELHKYFKKRKPVMTHKDFVTATNKAKEGDFIYFDPPYDIADDKKIASFTAYTKSDFDKDDQVRLAEQFKKLDKRGVKLMLSNLNTKLIQELYAGYNIHVVKARRAINSNGKGRGDVEEVIITNY